MSEEESTASLLSPPTSSLLCLVTNVRSTCCLDDKPEIIIWSLAFSYPDVNSKWHRNIMTLCCDQPAKGDSLLADHQASTLVPLVSISIIWIYSTHNEVLEIHLDLNTLPLNLPRGPLFLIFSV